MKVKKTYEFAEFEPCGKDNKRLGEIILKEKDDGEFECPEKIQVMRAGEYRHAWYGKMSFTPEMFQSFKKNFDSKARGIDIAVDFGHDSGGPAAGWVKNIELENADSQLWFEVDWTPSGKKALEDKDYRYLSADFMEEYEDAETEKQYGATMLGAGLTNRPFIKKMQPTTNLSEGGNMLTEQEIKQLQEKALKVDELTTQLADANAKLTEVESKLSEAETKLQEAEEKRIEKEKEEHYNQLLEEEKVSPAQKEAILSMDLEDAKNIFANAPKIKLHTQPEGDDTEPGQNDNKNFEDMVIDLADKEGISTSDAMRKIFKDRPDLKKKYYEEYDQAEDVEVDDSEEE